jgi:hypothetical protein
MKRSNSLCNISKNNLFDNFGDNNISAIAKCDTKRSNSSNKLQKEVTSNKNIQQNNEIKLSSKTKINLSFGSIIIDP